MKSIYTFAAAIAAVILLQPAKANAQDRFIDNTFVSAGAGANVTILHPLNPKTWGDMGFATDITFGKWFSPRFGARLGVHGGWNKCKQDLTAQDIPAGTPYGFSYIHADFLYSISKDILGMNEDRIWDAAIYVNGGAAKVSKSRTVFAKGQYTWAFGVGMLNEFKVCKEASITLDLMAIATNPSVFTKGGGRAVVFPTATVGISFNLGEIF